MKIIDAIWEQKNLGVDTVEIEVSNQDTTTDLIQALLNCQAEYTVVKIPPNRFDLMEVLNQREFHFIECIFETENNAKTLHHRNPVQEKKAYVKMCNETTYCLMDEEDLQRLYEEIRQMIFSTDRIAIDSFFGNEKATNRYVNWIATEVSNGTAKAFKVIYRENVIGFFVHKEIEKNVYQGLLMGLYHDYLGTGLGFLIDEKEREEHLKKSKRAIGYISSNNVPRMKLSFEARSYLAKMQYVYIKHK